MRRQTIFLTLLLAAASASPAEAKRGFSMKGLFGSSKSSPAPAAAPKPPTPAPAAPAAAAAPKPAAPAAQPATAAAPTAVPSAPPARSNTFIFVSTGGTRPVSAAEDSEAKKRRLEKLPAGETTATVNDPANALIKPAGYAPPTIGSAPPVSASAVPGFKVVN